MKTPNDVEAEKILIGSILRSNGEIAPLVRNTVDRDDFYDPRHRLIMECINEMKGDIDPVSVADKAKRKGYDDRVSYQYLDNLLDAQTTSAGWKHWADIIKEHSVRKQLIDQGRVLAEECANLSSGQTIDSITQAHKQAIRLIEHGVQDESWNNEAETEKVFTRLEERRQGKINTGYKFGFPLVQDRVIGLEPKSLYVLGAESHTGKTALALQVSDQIVAPEKRVAYFTLESNIEALQERRLARFAGITLNEIRRGVFEANPADAFDIARQRLLASTLEVYEASKYRCVESLMAKCESLAMDKDFGLIVIDHLQLTYSKAQKANRHLEISHITALLADMAKDLDCPILLLSQLNEGGHVKESRDTFNNADHVWMLQKGANDDIRDLTGEKGRDTGTWGPIQLNFEGQFMTFTEMELYEGDDRPW